MLNLPIESGFIVFLGHFTPTNVRSNLRTLLKKHGIKMETEKEIKLTGVMYTVSENNYRNRFTQNI